MADFLQYVDHGSQLDDGDIEWFGANEYVVPGSNRRRLLDHARTRPGPDGWLADSTLLGPLGLTPAQQVDAGYDHDPILTRWTRIRWEPHSAPETPVRDLDRGDA